MINPNQILKEIDHITSSPSYKSRQSGKFFYEIGNLGKLVQDYLKEQGMTKTKFAQNVSMSPSSLSRILSGKTHMSENLIFRTRSYFQKISEDERENTQNTLDLFLWKKTNNKNIQDLISKTSISLSTLLLLITQSNRMGSKDSILDSLQKAQLIALLETMLVQLKAPAINNSENKKFFKWLSKFAKKGAEKGIEENVANTISAVLENGKELVEELANAETLTNLDKFL